MKRILIILCVLVSVIVGCAPVLAAAETSSQGSQYYPISVQEYVGGNFDEPRICKTYRLSLSDDPTLIDTENFERDGRLYYLLDMTRDEEVGVDTREQTETITQASKTNNMEKILQELDAEKEITTEDGYTGILRLDHTTVKVTTDGYATKTKNVSATRKYENLSQADLSLIPKSIEDGGNTLTLADVQWSESLQTDGEGGMVTRYTASASYTGTSSYRYATGYTVTANYTGEVAKTDCSVAVYNLYFGSVEAPKDSRNSGTNAETHNTQNDTDSDENNTPTTFNMVMRVIIVICLILLLIALISKVVKQIRERR